MMNEIKFQKIKICQNIHLSSRKRTYDCKIMKTAANPNQKSFFGYLPFMI
jgi:hypothetical protein